MAHQFYLSIKGTKQGQFKGESTNPQRGLKWIEVHGFAFGVNSPYDAGSGNLTGKRQHSPITITKEWGAASPLFLNACTTNEVLSEVVIEVVDKASAGGQETVAETITLTNAVIVSHRQHIGRAAMEGRNLTEFRITFQKIESTGKASKSAKDSWLA